MFAVPRKKSRCVQGMTSTPCPLLTAAATYQLWQSNSTDCPGRISQVLLATGSPQRQAWMGTQAPSCKSCPSGHRHPVGEDAL